MVKNICIHFDQERGYRDRGSFSAWFSV